MVLHEPRFGSRTIRFKKSMKSRGNVEKEDMAGLIGPGSALTPYRRQGTALPPEVLFVEGSTKGSIIRSVPHVTG